MLLGRRPSPEAVVGCFPVLTEAEIFAREGQLTTHLLKLLRSLPHE